MTTWAEFRARLILTLGDTDRSQPDFTDDELLVYLNYALTAISDHTAQRKSYTLALDAAAASLALPSDYLALGPVYVTGSAGVNLFHPQRRAEGAPFFDLIETGAGQDLSFYEEPPGSLTFGLALAAGTSITAHYWGYWTALTADADLLGVKRWMEEALAWNVAAQAMAKPGMQTSRLRQYLTKRDAGSPNDNPLLQYAAYCRKEYDRILANWPAQDRSGWELAG